MGFNFRKTIKLCKGVSLNLSKNGVGLSAGVKGARVSMSPTGRKTATFSIPGTGISYSQNLGGSKTGSRKASDKNSKVSAKELEEAKKAVAEYEAYVQTLRGFHKESDPPMDWIASYNIPAPAAGTPEYDQWLTVHNFSEQVVKGQEDAYLAVIEATQPFADLSMFGSDFEYATDEPSRVEVEFTVKFHDVLPEEAIVFAKDQTATTKALTKTEYFDIMQDYVCSCSIRVAREVFAALPVDTVIIHATDLMLNTATGNDEEFTILSVMFERDGFQNINFERIDPSDFVCAFEHNMKFNKTAGFTPVAQL